VQPSRFEGFGLTVVEAMAALVPVLVSDIEGPMELMGNGKAGYFFQADDYEDCAGKILDIIRLSKEEEFIDNRKKIAAYARGRYDITLTAARYLDEYRKVIHLKKIRHG
jgi:glycosyltransferase involved in cell wall biosynthesis